MGEKIIRKINSYNFWKDFYLRNDLEVRNQKILIIRGDSFTDSIFNVSNNQDLIQVEFDIYLDNRILSHIKKYFIKKIYDYRLEEDFNYKDIIRLEEDLLEKSTNMEKSVLSVHGKKDEASRFGKKEGASLIMIKKKYRNNNDIKFYEEELADLFTYKFIDRE